MTDFTDMELDRKFQMATACSLLTIGSLGPDQHYTVVHAERVNTRYGPIVLLAILEYSTTSVKAFQPKRHGEVESDEDIEDINSGHVQLYLVHKGTCP